MGCRIQRKYGNYKNIRLQTYKYRLTKIKQGGRLIQVDGKGEQSQNE